MGWYWNPLGLVGILGGITLVALAALVFFTRPDRPENRRLALLLFFESTGGFLGGGVVYLTDTYEVAYAAQAVTYLNAGIIFLLYLYFLASLPAPLARPLRSRPAPFVLAAMGLAFIAIFLARTDRFVADMVPTTYSRLESVAGPWTITLIILPGILATLYGLAVAISMWRSAPRGTPRRRQGAAYAVAFGWRDLNWLWFLIAAFLLASTSAVVFWTFQFTALVFPFLLTYAVLKHQLFAIDLKLKWTLSRGTVAAVFLIAFLVASQLVENMAGARFGWLGGALAAGLLLFALSPLQRFAQRLSDAAMPRVRDTTEYRTVRKREVYQAAYESALVDGRITEKERDVLATLADHLELSARETLEIERNRGSARRQGGTPTAAARATR